MDIIRARMMGDFVKFIIILLAVIISLSSLCKRKPEENYLEPINISNNSGRSENPSIAVDSRNTVHLVWTDNTPGIAQGNQWNQEILYAFKAVNGNWSNPMNISNNERASRYPCIVIDKNDNIHLAWQDCSPDGYWRIFYSSKRPNSETWSVPETISAMNWDVDPKIDVDATGRLFLVWYAGGYSGLIHFSMRAVDGTWTLPITISPMGYVSNGVVTSDIRGNVHVAWDCWDGDIRTEVFYVMRDTNGDWSEPVILFPRNPNQIVYSVAPKLTSDKEGNIHITWLDSVLVYIKKLHGVWLSPEFPLKGSPGGIVVDGDGTVYIIAYSGEWGKSGLIKKPKNGVWANPLLLPKVSSAFSSLAVDNNRGTKHIAWSAIPPDTFDTYDIYYIEIKNY